MSSRRSRKTANPKAKAPEPIITRTKSKQLKNKEVNSPEKPELTKPETKSTKVVKTVKRPKESLLKVPVVVIPDDEGQVEYYPNMLKRDVTAKKIMLKPKHNFKVIATTNKRKRGTPHKGTKPSPTDQNKLQESPQVSKSRRSKASASRPELSMQDMVRMMDETRSLSDEDFMEILTCPSPVWWEDPPDGGFDEDAIHTRSPEPPPKEVANQNKKRKLSPVESRNTNNSKIITIEYVGDLSKETYKATDEKHAKKKQKLESILGNIKNKTSPVRSDVKNDTHDVKNETNDVKNDTNDVKNDTKNRKLSESEGDISDLSLNEEEILKNLEEMEIPMEKTPTESVIPIEQNTTKLEIPIEKTTIESELPIEQTKTEWEVPFEQFATDSNILSDIKNEINDSELEEYDIETKHNEVEPKNENVDREILSMDIKKEIKEEFLIKSPVFSKNSSGSEFNSSDVKSDDIVIVNSCTNSSLSNPVDSISIVDLDSNSNSDIITKTEKDNSFNETVPIKKTKDLSEFITVYKITPDKIKNDNDSEKSKLTTENTKTTKIETVRGKLNDFFKQCKNNIRLKKIENSMPAISLTDVNVKETIDNEKNDEDSKIVLDDDKNRLKSCDYCVEKTENGTKDFSCEKCAAAPTLPCGLCNLVTDTKEVSKNHVSSCKDVARISWSNNYVLNPT